MNDYDPYGGANTPHRSGSHGGGGFLTSPGGDGSGSQFNAFNKRDNQSVRPVTIKQALNAEASGQADGSFKVDGHPISLITVVALMRARERQSSFYSFMLDDGTATADAQLWMNENDPAEKDSQLAEIPINSYVRVYGQIRVFNDKSRITIIRMQPVNDCNEVTTHLLEVVYAHLFFTRGPIRSDGTVGMAGGQTSNANPFTSNTGNDVMMSDANNFSPLQSRIIQFVSSRDSDTGPNISEIVKQANQNEPAVRQALEWLVSEGHLYNTIDDDHFRAIAL
ncbi:hypothetical protein BDF19DRAFT_442911 [Syncephalis fuscata]|nr:hypothetical protein BDF19DRAFT_442911 [Syncephalis fuscata]